VERGVKILASKRLEVPAGLHGPVCRGGIPKENAKRTLYGVKRVDASLGKRESLKTKKKKESGNRGKGGKTHSHQNGCLKSYGGGVKRRVKKEG